MSKEPTTMEAPRPNPLQVAIACMARYEALRERDGGFTGEPASRNRHDAAVWAALAQAEAQTRIAECLETLIEMQTESVAAASLAESVRIYGGDRHG